MTNTITVPVVHAPTAPEHAVGQIQEWLAHAAKKGTTFSNGSTFEIGWLPFRVVLDSRGLRVSAPRVGSAPLAYTEDCSEALNLVASQRALIDSFRAKPSACSCMDTALVVKDLFSCRDWTLERSHRAKKGRSGWVIGAYDSKCDRTKASDTQRIRLWELFCRKPEIGPFLELPKGWHVSFEGGRPVVLDGGNVAVPHEGSYYAGAFAG